VTAAPDGLAVRERPGAAPGETVLWFHGYAMDSSVWTALWDLLPGWRHVGLDLPGHGASRPLRPGEDLRSLAATIAAWAVEHRVRHLAGLSFGTILALEVAMQAPAAFERIVLGAPALAGGAHDPGVERRYEDLARLHAERGPGPHLARLWMQAPPDLFRCARDRPLLWLHLFWLACRHRWDELGGAGTGMLALTTPHQDPACLAAVRARTLVAVGEHDLAAYKATAALVAATIPGCERRDLPGTGHLCLIEEPEVAATAIEAHLAAQ
jgi:2-succinyl-6-hydroxy-2,4-cyclohexadiene-1-carboxylate synthase